tara:strand:- start:146 stop:388 length:243 start_codon:yes stop_codon:yes gene_type:complete
MTQGDLILIGIAFLIGIINDKYSPKLYHYSDTKVVLNRKYQCPKYCKVNHYHNVYFDSESSGMVVEKNKIGKKVKNEKKK